MPVKVRCPECRKVLKAPDKARGKAIKCPQCATKVRVPAGSKDKAAAQSGADSSDLIASLDLSDVEDKQARICPKCATEVSDEDELCPACGVDLATGMLSERERRRRARKGPPPEEYYERLWRDPFEFVKRNKGFAIRTAVFWIVGSLLGFGCLFMVLWCSRTPPRTFWAFFGVIALMVPPGWTWFLHTEIIEKSMAKVKKLKRINFDFFLCSALGFKLVFWLLAFAAPLHLVGGLLMYMQKPLIGGMIVGAGGLLSVLVFPIVMVHMTMPVTYRAWMAPSMLGVLGRVAAPTLMCCALFLVINLPTLAAWGTIGAVYGDDLGRFGGQVYYNSMVALAEMREPPKAGPGEDEAPPDPLAEWRDVEEKEVNAQVLVVPSLLWGAGCLAFGFTSVISMRANGLFAYYFKRDLDLITEERQVTYKRKSETHWKEVLSGRQARVVRTGIAFVFWGIIVRFVGVFVMLGLAILIPMLVLLNMRDAAFAQLATMVILALWVRVAVVVGDLLNMVGQLLCLAVPRETQTSAAIWAAAICMVTSAGLSTADVLSERGYIEPLPVWAELSGGLIGLLGVVFYLVFVGQLAEFMRRSDLAETSSKVIKVGAAACVEVVGLVMALALGLRIATAIFGVSALVNMLLYMFLYPWLLFQIMSTMKEAQQEL